MPYTPKHVNLRIENPTAVANQTTAVRLDQIQPVASIAGGTTYVRSILVEADMTFVGDAAAQVGEDHAHDVIQSIMLRIPGLDRPVYELPIAGGSRLRYVQHALRGKRQRAANGGAGGVLTPAGGGGTAVRLKYEILFYNPRAEREDDPGMPIDFLREAADLLMQWNTIAAGGFAGAVISATGSIVRVTAELYERPEFVLPAFHSIQLFRFSALQGQIPVAGRQLLALIEVAAQSNAAGQGTIAAADRTSYQLNCDGRMIKERIAPQATIYEFDNYVATARAEELADHEAGTNSWLPVVLPQRGPGSVQLTKSVLVVNRPEFTFEGADTSPELVAVTYDLNDRQAALNRIDRAGVPVPAGFTDDPGSFLSVKTGSKQPIAKGPDGGARLPLRLHMRPVQTQSRGI